MCDYMFKTNGNPVYLEDLRIPESMCEGLTFGFISQRYFCGHDMESVNPTKCSKGNLCVKLSQGEKNA